MGSTMFAWKEKKTTNQNLTALHLAARGGSDLGSVRWGLPVVVGFRIQVGWHQKSNGITLPKQTCFLKVDMLWHANLGICRTSEGDDGVICMSGHLAVVQLLAEAQPQAALATCRRDKNYPGKFIMHTVPKKLEAPVIF